LATALSILHHAGAANIVLTFVEKITTGTAGLADSVAALLLRLAFRVSNLERAVEQQTKRLQQLAKQPKPAPVVALAPVMTGIDTATGAAVRIEPKRPRGRPLGSRDSRPRPSRARHHNLEAEVSSHILDNGWDDLGAG
jgi:hypothetical protein